jgi:hypothetical protein
MNKLSVLYIDIFIFFLVATILPASLELSADNIRFSSDITTQVDASYYKDEYVVSVGKYTAGPLFDSILAGIPGGAEIDALLVYSNRIVFSTDIDFKKDEVIYANEDLVLLDAANGQLGIFFDGSAHGVKPSANLDAVAISGKDITDPLYLSFDITVTLPTIGVVNDEDIVILDGGIFTGVIKGVDLGIPIPADIDALYIRDNTLYFSLDITVDINGSIGVDSDLWAMDMGTSNVTLLGSMGIDSRADLIGLDQPVDTDGDWLTDYEEYSGLDEPASTVPGLSLPLSPRGYVTSVILPDTDGDKVNDGLEAIYGTDPTDPLSFPDLSGSMLIIR